MDVFTFPSPTLDMQPSLILDKPSYRSAPFQLFHAGLDHQSLLDTSDQGSQTWRNNHGCEVEFEFEAYNSQEFQKSMHELLKQQQQPPLLSFADELFNSRGLLPLKLPPRLQNITACSESSIYSGSRPCISCTTSPTMISALSSINPFARFMSSKKEEDPDPFMAALENVKKDIAEMSPIRRRDLAGRGRRARSLSPLRISTCSYCSSSESKKSIKCLNNSRHEQSSEMTLMMNSKNNNIDAVVRRGSSSSSSSSCCKNSKMKVIKHFLSWRLMLEERQANKNKLKNQLRLIMKGIKKRAMAPWHGPLICFGFGYT